MGEHPAYVKDKKVKSKHGRRDAGEIEKADRMRNRRRWEKERHGNDPWQKIRRGETAAKRCRSRKKDEKTSHEVERGET